MALSVGLTALFLVGFRLILKDWEKAGVLCSLLVILFFFFGHIANSLEKWTLQRHLSFEISTLAWIWLVLFLLLSFIILQTSLSDKFTQLLNIVSIMLIIFPMITIISTTIAISTDHQSERDVISQIRGDIKAEASVNERSQSELPDIYYIIFDAYERADLLQEFYGYDNSAFIEALEDRDFYVASDSRSNYLSTTYSLNTSLNLIYFHDFPTSILRQARYNLRTNYVNNFLRDQGYQVVVFDSGTGDTNNQYADIFVSPESIQSGNGSEANPFEQLLLRTTVWLLLDRRGSLESAPEGADDPVISFSSVNHELSVRRERISHAFEHLTEYASKEGNYFLFAHIYLPHIPFLYGPDGEELKYSEDLSLYWYAGESNSYIEYYTYQLDYLNKAVLNAIDTILAESEKPVVIILQSDHGDGKYLDWDEPTAQGVNIRSAIHNSIYYSDLSYQTLYSTITPVNTFRLTLNHWFGTQYPILPDKVYFHEHPLSTPFNETPNFIECCAQFGLCLPDHAE
ncbi:MAG: hypothetical protein MUO76_07630 [Anaerolineaceae bacterium]|nr:hypothetical protein [Anaerolineaceae bacterium]